MSTRLLQKLNNWQNKGMIEPSEAIAILGCCEMMNEGLTNNNIVHPDNFIVQYGTRSVESLRDLMIEQGKSLNYIKE